MKFEDILIALVILLLLILLEVTKSADYEYTHEREVYNNQQILIYG